MDTDTALNVQNGFFNQVRKDRTRVTICLNNGQRISGLVKSFDKFTLLLDTKNGEQMIFKHAVSTVSVFRPADAQGRAERRGREEPGREGKGFGNFIDFEKTKG